MPGVRTDFFHCKCHCNAIGITVDNDPEIDEVAIELWEPSRAGMLWSWRLRKIWDVLKGRALMEETLLTKEQAGAMGKRLIEASGKIPDVVSEDAWQVGRVVVKTKPPRLSGGWA